MKALALLLCAVSLTVVSCKTTDPMPILVLSASDGFEVPALAGVLGLGVGGMGRLPFLRVKGWSFEPGLMMEYAYIDDLDLHFRLRPYLYIGKLFFDENAKGANKLPWFLRFGVSGLFTTPDFSEFVWGVSPVIGVKFLLFYIPTVFQVRYDFYSVPHYNRWGINFIFELPLPLYLFTED